MHSGWRQYENGPDTITYSSVVIREKVHIALTMAALYYLEVKAADVLNTYVTTPNREKIWTVLDPEFGDDAGKSAIVAIVLHDFKSVGVVYSTSCTIYAGIGV